MSVHVFKYEFRYQSNSGAERALASDPMLRRFRVADECVTLILHTVVSLYFCYGALNNNLSISEHLVVR